MVEVVPFLPTVRKKYHRYGTHVLGFRHFPEGRDGMTPVQRRSIWTLGNELSAFTKPKMVKTARAAGDCLGKYHPHEIGSIVGAMTGLSQAKSSAPLIMGVGNWGSWDDPPAAERYTSCYLSKYAGTFFDPDELTQVPMDESYDGDRTEPRFLPAKIPHLLLQGASSFGVAARGEIPPCEPDWVVDAVSAILAGKVPKTPKDFAYRWGGKLVSLEDEWMKTGSGSATFRPIVRVDEARKTLTLVSLAPRLNVDSLLSNLENVPSFGGSCSEPSGKELVSITILTKRGGDFAELKAALRKLIHTKLHYTFLYIDQYTGAHGEVAFRPFVTSPVDFLQKWVKWRTSIVVGAAKHRISNLEKDSNRQRLMIRVIEHRKQLLVALERAKNKQDLAGRVKTILKCTADEAETVLQVQFHRLASMELSGLRARIADNTKKIAENAKIVKTPGPRLVADADGARKLIVESLKEAGELAEINESKPRRRKRKAA